jgi:plasmid stabilization system protein ParE
LPPLSSKSARIQNLPGVGRAPKSLIIADHLFFSRKLAGRAAGRIRRPRHFLLYRVTEPGMVEISRVLHDSMELKAHLPEEYRGLPE